MARLFQAGAEMREHYAEGISTHTSTPSFTYTTEEARTGSYSYKCVSSSSSQSELQLMFGVASWHNDLVQYVRGYFKFNQFPNSGVHAAIIRMTNLVAGSFPLDDFVVINSLGEIGLGQTSGVAAAIVNYTGTGPPLNLGTWYRIELSVAYPYQSGFGHRSVRVNGINYITNDTRSVSSEIIIPSANSIRLGWCLRSTDQLGTLNNGLVHYIDDIAVNASEVGGSLHNSWPGEGSIDVLKPISDGPRGTGWAAALGETVNLWADIQPKDLNTGRYILHNSTVQSIYYTNYQTLGSLGIENNSQIQTMQPILAAGKFNTPNTARPITFARSGHPAWPTMLFNPPNVLSGTAYPGNWEIQRPIFTDKALWSSSVWTLSQNSAFGFSRVSSSGNFILVRYAGIVVEYKKPIEAETSLASEGVINIVTRRERSSSEILSAASNYVLTNARQRTFTQTLSSATNTSLLSQRQRLSSQSLLGNSLWNSISSRGRSSAQTLSALSNYSLALRRERFGVNSLSANSLWNILGTRERSLTQSLSSASNFTSTSQRQRFGLQILTASGSVSLSLQRLRFLTQALEASSDSSFSSILEAVGEADLEASTLMGIESTRERRYAAALSSVTNATFDAVRELYDSIDFESLSDLSQMARRERTTDVAFSGRSNLILALLFETLFEMALEASSSFSGTSAIEAAFSGTWLGTSEMDAESVAERMSAFGLSSESSFDSLFLRERSDELHTSATTDLEMPISRDRSGDLDFDAASLLALLSLLERQGIMGLSADTDFDLFASTLKSSGIFLTGETALDIESVRERWVALDAAASTEFSGLAQAIYASGLTMTGNSIMFVTSEAGGLILAEMALNADGSFTIEAIRNLTNSIDLSTNSDLDVASLIRERAFSLNYSSESVQSLLSTIEAVGDLSFDSATDFTIAQERERSLSAAFDAQSSILVPFERLRSVAVPYSASGTLSLSLDLTVLGQLYFQSTGTLLSEAVRELGGTLPLDSTGTLELQSARELSASLGLESTGYLAITYHSIEYIPSIEYYFKHRGNRFFRNIPIREMLVPVLREPWFNEFHIEQQLQTKDLLPFFIKIDRDDR